MKRIYACFAIVAALLATAFYSSFQVQRFADDISTDLDCAIEAIRNSDLPTARQALARGADRCDRMREKMNHLLRTEDFTELETALRFAAERGVDVHLILPGKPDKWFVYALAKTHYKALISSGVKISEWQPGFTHAKIVIADGVEAVAGTINLDYRSLYHHFENAVWMRGVDCLPRIEADFQDTLAQCRTVEPTRQSVWQGKKLLHLVGMVLKFIAPLI